MQTATFTAPLNLHLLKDEAEEMGSELVPGQIARTQTHFPASVFAAARLLFDDYEYFPVGITGRLNPRYADYVVFRSSMTVRLSGYVSRHTWPKRGYEPPTWLPQDQT